SGEGARIHGGRWNRRGAEALYLATPLATCAAEFRRMAEGQGKGPESFLPRMLHTIAVTDLDVVDLTQPGSIEAVGLETADLDAADWSACQAIGDAVDTLGRATVWASQHNRQSRAKARKARSRGLSAALSTRVEGLRGCSSMVEHQLPKLRTRV